MGSESGLEIWMEKKEKSIFFFFSTEKWTWVAREGSKYVPAFKSSNPNF